jgi:Flp pilus assembly protein TadG
MMLSIARSLTGSRRRGAHTVEVAFVSPVLFLTILGLFEIGRGLMVVHLLNNAAQAGCRAGIIEGQSTANIQTAVNNALTATGVSGDSVTVQVNDGSADASTAGVGDEITVLVSVPISAITWVPGAKFLTGSLQGQYTMRRE